METCGHPNPDRQAGSLETFLVEWKQLRPNETASLARFLETFLVEWKRAAYNHAEYLPEPLKPS